MTPPQQPGQGDPKNQGDPDQEPEDAAEQPRDDATPQESADTDQDAQANAEEAKSEESGEPAETPAEGSSAVAAEGSGDGDTEGAAENTGTTAGTNKKKMGIVLGAVAAVVLVVGGGIALFFTFAGGASAQSVAEDYVALSDREAHDPKSVTAKDYEPLICGKAMPQIEQLQKQKQEFLKMARPEQLEQIKKIKTNVKGVKENGDTAQATFQSSAPGQQPKTSKLNMVKEDGDWQLCTG